MRVLTKSLASILCLSLIQAGNVSAEPIPGMLPGVFPGSGGLARPLPDSDLPPAYPEWPERTFRTTLIPPPPPGPYMSSAMSDIDAFPDDSGGLRNVTRERPVPSPVFEADMPWPETAERERPERWLPESGEYRFVPDEIVRRLETPAPSTGQERQRYQPYSGFPPAPPRRQPYYGYY